MILLILPGVCIYFLIGALLGKASTPVDGNDEIGELVWFLFWPIILIIVIMLIILALIDKLICKIISKIRGGKHR